MLSVTGDQPPAGGSTVVALPTTTDPACLPASAPQSLAVAGAAHKALAAPASIMAAIRLRQYFSPAVNEISRGFGLADCGSLPRVVSTNGGSRANRLRTSAEIVKCGVMSYPIDRSTVAYASTCWFGVTVLL